MQTGKDQTDLYKSFNVLCDKKIPIINYIATDNLTK